MASSSSITRIGRRGASRQEQEGFLLEAQGPLLEPERLADTLVAKAVVRGLQQGPALLQAQIRFARPQGMLRASYVGRPSVRPRGHDRSGAQEIVEAHLVLPAGR